MDVAILFSGGKDSTMVLYWCLQNDYNVKYLVSAIPTNPESMIFHTSNIHLTQKIAEAVGIDFVPVHITSMNEKGEERELLNAVKKLNVDAIATGGVSSQYQSTIFSRIAEELEIKLIAPYWNKPHARLIQDALDAGFDIRFTSISADGLDSTWLGRKLDQAALADLKKLGQTTGINIGGEGGEYCTTVIDGPIFKKRIRIVQAEKHWQGSSGRYIIKDAVLVDKKLFD